MHTNMHTYAMHPREHSYIYDQLAWASERSCDVTVAVPTPLAPGAACAVLDAAAQRPLDDRPATCPHLQLAATAATTSESCAMSANGELAPLNPAWSPYVLQDTTVCTPIMAGVDLFAGCGLDRLVVGRDGVCVAALDPPAVPRAACFDTKVGVGADGAGQLAAWIDRLPIGATAMVVSCSRLAWANNIPEVCT